MQLDQNTISTPSMQKTFLLTSGVLLSFIGLTYGIAHTDLIPFLFSFKIDSVALDHIFRANMGFYLGTGAFWLTSAFIPQWRKVAVASVVFLMIGLSIGRILSLVIDGQANGILHFYLGLELIGVIWGSLILANLKDVE